MRYTLLGYLSMEVNSVLITGSTGFIGTHLANYFQQKNIRVYRASQRPTPEKSNMLFKMGTPFDWNQVPDIDTVVHLAWDMRPAHAQSNIDGTIQLASEGLKRSIKNQLFFSSFSAHSAAQSTYGKSKLAVENFFKKNHLKVCRPGLVIGQGGVYQKMVDTVLRAPFLPLIDGGGDPVPTIEISSLCAASYKLLLSSEAEGNLFGPTCISLKALLTDIAQRHNKKPRFISIPSSPLLPLLRSMEKLGISAPITFENVLGLISNRTSLHKSNLHLFSTPS